MPIGWIEDKGSATGRKRGFRFQVEVRDEAKMRR
jgi:hypothetical protein